MPAAKARPPAGRRREPVVATIGYERAAPDDVIATLATAGVDTVIDVRAVAWSRRPEFCKRALAQSIEAAGLAYHHLPGVGNPKPGRDAAKSGDMKGFRRLFADHMRSDEFAADLGRAADLAAAGRAALLCLERDPGRCHRVYVAEALGERLGLPVVHLEP